MGYSSPPLYLTLKYYYFMIYLSVNHVGYCEIIKNGLKFGKSLLPF